MPQLVRLGCAGLAAVVIAALTSIGLYAVVAGQVFTVGAAARPQSNLPPVLVTIQAGPGSATPLPTATETPMPASLLGGPVASSGVAAPAPTPIETRATSTATAAPTPALGTPTPPAATSANGAASSPAAVAGPADRRELPRQVLHDGLALEILSAERDWQATLPDGTPRRPREGMHLVTILVRFSNGTAEARHVADADLTLVGEDGSRFTPLPTGPAREPRTLTVPVLPGDVIRGWLTYEVPAGEQPVRLQWSPTRPDRPRAETAFLLGVPR